MEATKLALLKYLLCFFLKIINRQNLEWTNI